MTGASFISWMNGVTNDIVFYVLICRSKSRRCKDSWMLLWAAEPIALTLPLWVVHHSGVVAAYYCSSIVNFPVHLLIHSEHYVCIHTLTTLFDVYIGTVFWNQQNLFHQGHWTKEKVSLYHISCNSPSLPFFPVLFSISIFLILY